MCSSVVEIYAGTPSTSLDFILARFVDSAMESRTVTCRFGISNIFHE
jgi:hypothetical protein